MRSKLRSRGNGGLLRRPNLRSHKPHKSFKRPAARVRRTKPRESALLMQLLESVNRARSLGEIYKAAVDCVCAGLEADRASILTYDESLVMRFRFTKGLSEGYRQAVEGHAPWKPTDSNPQIVTIADVREVEMADTLRTAIANEGIGAMAFIPLTYEGTLLGKFMVYYDHPHEFKAKELRLASA